MSRTERLPALIDAAHDCLDEGDLEGARAKHALAARVDRRNPDVMCLDAQLTALEGDLEAGYAIAQEIVAAHPEHVHGLLCAADIGLGIDPDAAVELARKAADLVEDEGDLVAAVLLLADGLCATDRAGEAREVLGELSSSAIDDPDIILDVANALLTAEDPTTAELWLRRLTSTEDEHTAHAWHLIGAAREAKGDKAGMVAAWREVLARDRAEPWQPVVADDDLEQLAAAAFEELPEDVRARLADVPIMIDDLPSDHLVEDGVDPRLLGLFEGTPLSEQSAVGGVPTITTIHLYRKNLERAGGGDPEAIAEEVRITVLHETAHYFGLDDDDLEKLGLD
ncbi:MAG: metallopeptidase family protein [Myxococcales bacterium]|nr:metallopeptidase family protein [Myxococcales bacterium]